MTFINFGTELVNLNHIYEIDFKRDENENVQILFFYNVAGSTSGGVKTSKPYKTANDAVAALINIGISIRPPMEAD